jgi:hypothetical protein
MLILACTASSSSKMWKLSCNCAMGECMKKKSKSGTTPCPRGIGGVSCSASNIMPSYVVKKLEEECARSIPFLSAYP